MEAMAAAGAWATANSGLIKIASTAFNVLGAISQANTNADNYQTQSGMNEYNAAVSRNQSAAALSESAAAQSAQRRRARELLGEQRAGIAQSGTGFGGTNADLLERSQTLSELDALNLAYEGDMKSKGYLQQAEIETMNAATNRRNVGTARTAGYLGAGRALLSGMGSYGRGVTQAPAPVANGNTRFLGG